MKTTVKKGIERVVMATAKRGANSASMWQYYQPKEPQALKRLKK